MLSKIKMQPILVTLMLTCVSHAAQSADWYAGVGEGRAYSHDLDDRDGVEYDSNYTVLNLFGGYVVNDFVTAELGYLYIGNIGGGLSFKTEGATFSGLGRYPISDSISLFAEGGAYINHASGNGVSDNGIAPLAGFGVTVNVAEQVDLQARYRFLWQVGNDQKMWESNVSSATMELVWYPGRVSYVPPVAAPTPMPNAEALMNENEQGIMLSYDVLFPFGKYTLKPEGVAALNALYQQIVNYQPTLSELNIDVVSYTGHISADAFNRKLAEARANTVAHFLVRKGLASSQLRIEGRDATTQAAEAKCRDITRSDTPRACLVPNRWVEVRVTDKKKTSR